MLARCSTKNRGNRCLDNECFCGYEPECEWFSPCREPGHDSAMDNSNTARCHNGEYFNCTIN